MDRRGSATRQRPRCPEAYAELPIILMTQTNKLLFRAVHYELINTRARVRNDDLLGPLDLVPRASRELSLIVRIRVAQAAPARWIRFCQ